MASVLVHIISFCFGGGEGGGGALGTRKWTQRGVYGEGLKI